MVQINANVNLINAICVYPEFSCFSTLTSLSKNRQGNVNSFCIVQFSRSFFNSSSLSDDFVIISHLFVFVKRFLKFFSNFLDFVPIRHDIGGFCLVAFQRLIYHITSFRFCQEVSEIFFSKSLDFFVPDAISGILLTAFAATYLLYHFVFVLSSGFSKFSEKLFLDFPITL